MVQITKKKTNPPLIDLLCEYNAMGFVKAIYIRFFTRIVNIEIGGCFKCTLNPVIELYQGFDLFYFR
jgi:hypothetical protein